MESVEFLDVPEPEEVESSDSEPVPAAGPVRRRPSSLRIGGAALLLMAAAITIAGQYVDIARVLVSDGSAADRMIIVATFDSFGNVRPPASSDGTSTLIMTNFALAFVGIGLLLIVTAVGAVLPTRTSSLLRAAGALALVGVGMLAGASWLRWIDLSRQVTASRQSGTYLFQIRPGLWFDVTAAAIAAVAAVLLQVELMRWAGERSQPAG
ncbi:hypothetical protein SAMN05444157_0243 [Frankineae bacterium MT45]|nr:hypothetical protein SAMN05444157_0243 [Frankineae bacterium MT45]